MLASLFGALIGGLFAVIGGWLAVHWQATREARGVAGSLLAEMIVTQRLLDSGGQAEVYQNMLDDLKKTGKIHDRQALIDMFDNAPQEALPVYYSMVGKLGLLPGDLAADVVQCHATMVSLPKIIVRFLGKRELDPATVKELAKTIERQFQDNTRLRSKLIAELAAFAEKPVRSTRNRLATSRENAGGKAALPREQ